MRYIPACVSRPSPRASATHATWFWFMKCSRASFLCVDIMSDEIRSLLRRAHSLSQGGHWVESARAIMMALATSARKQPPDLQSQHQQQHLMNALLPLLKFVVCHVMPLSCPPHPPPFSHALETAVEEDELPNAALLHLHVQALSFYPNQPDVSMSSCISICFFSKSHLPLAALVCHVSASKSRRFF